MRNNDNTMAWMIAIRDGNLANIQALLDQGDDINVPGPDGFTALMGAAYMGHRDIAQFLLNNGAHINAHDDQGWTALHKAVYRNHPDVIQLLLDHGADIDRRDHHGWTPLLTAAYLGHLDVVNVLLNNGANIHLRSYDHNFTALTWAARGGYFEIVRLLLNEGADINTHGDHGWTPLQQASRSGHHNITEFLIRQGAQFEDLNILELPDTEASEFSNQIAQGHIEAATELLKENPELLNAPNQFGQTPLMRAVIGGQLGAVRWLINQGVDLEAKSHDEFTALYFAVRALFSHRHEDEEVRAPYHEIVQIIAEKALNIDDPTQIWINKDETGILEAATTTFCNFVLK